MSNTDRVQSLDRALQLLMLFNSQEAELSLGEMARKVNLPKSTTSRLLGTLKANNFVDQDQNSLKYRLGFQIYALGNVYASSLDLRTTALPLMQELNELTSETVNLNVIDRGERVCIEKIESSHQVRNFVKLGERTSLCFGAAGKVLLAHMPEIEIEEVVANQKLSNDEITTLRQELEGIFLQGFCRTVGNRVAGSMAISAPIFEAAGLLAGGLSLSGPADRLMLKQDELTQAVTQTAAQISARLGYVREQSSYRTHK